MMTPSPDSRSTAFRMRRAALWAMEMARWAIPRPTSAISSISSRETSVSAACTSVRAPATTRMTCCASSAERPLGASSTAAAAEDKPLPLPGRPSARRLACSSNSPAPRASLSCAAAAGEVDWPVLCSEKASMKWSQSSLLAGNCAAKAANVADKPLIANSMESHSSASVTLARASAAPSTTRTISSAKARAWACDGLRPSAIICDSGCRTPRSVTFPRVSPWLLSCRRGIVAAGNRLGAT
mmetsp:Transcript_54737/g.138697  ORF Transcript_54737/g.138697 Transcript_54737/m.138697 type:complete len:241 (+) Transcript_54737:861-1583(+)